MAGFVRWLTDPDIGALLLRDDDVEDEVIADHVRKHWVCYTIPALVALAGLLCWVVLVPLAPVSIGWLPIVVGLALVLWGVFRALQTNIDQFVITNQKVFRVHGLLHRRQAAMPLGRILDTTVDKPLLGRILNFGHFTFESAAQDQGLRDIRYVSDIDARNLTIQRVTRDAGLRGPRVAR